MRQREPGFLYGLNAVDIVKIALAFMLSLAGFYLMWRTFFGPPMFDPTAIQAQVSKLKLQNGQRPDTTTPPSTDLAVPRGAQTPAAIPRPPPNISSRLDSGR